MKYFIQRTGKLELSSMVKTIDSTDRELKTRATYFDTAFSECKRLILDNELFNL